MLICKYCGKECKNKRSHVNHERLCPNNQERVYKNGMTGKKGSNHFIYAKKHGLPSPEVSVETRKKIADEVKSRSSDWHKNNGKKISKTVNEKIKNGEWHTSLAKKMHISYNGVDLHGSWELKYAQHLDANGITWIRNTDSFEYQFDGKTRRYTPDFYLPFSDEYIEIKGYKTDKDDAKWSQFPKHRKLVVLVKEDLQALLGIKL